MEKSEIVKTLKNEFDVTDRQIQDLLAGLYDAHTYHESMGAMYYSEISIKNYKASIQAAYGSIRKLNAALSNLSEMDRQILDDYYRQGNMPDKDTYKLHESDRMLMISLADKAMFEMGAAKSGFYEVTQCMEKALAVAEKNIRTPGAGNARQDGKKYIAAIEMLGRWFSDVFPDYKHSATPNTPFYKYVQVWFQCFVDPKDNDKDIRRHITNTLNHPDIRLNHDKGEK